MSRDRTKIAEWIEVEDPGTPYMLSETRKSRSRRGELIGLGSGFFVLIHPISVSFTLAFVVVPSATLLTLDLHSPIPIPCILPR